MLLSFQQGHALVAGSYDIRYVLNGTINAFKRTPVADSAETHTGNFPSEVKFKDFEARLPSDHFPVLVEFE